MASESIPKTQDRQAWIQQSDPEIRIFYTECRPLSNEPKGTILLIHGFPETSYQFRHAIVPLAQAGYHVLAPDYRGHGYSSKPPSGYTKEILAQELYKLVTEHVGIKDKIPSSWARHRRPDRPRIRRSVSQSRSQYKLGRVSSQERPFTKSQNTMHHSGTSTSKPRPISP